MNWQYFVVGLLCVCVCGGGITGKGVFIYRYVYQFILIVLSLRWITGLIIHFCLLPPSSQARFSRPRSNGNTNVWGKKPNSFFPNWTCILERFLHSRSFLPIWKDPGKWLICKEIITFSMLGIYVNETRQSVACNARRHSVFEHQNICVLQPWSNFIFSIASKHDLDIGHKVT